MYVFVLRFTSKLVYLKFRRSTRRVYDPALIVLPNSGRVTMNSSAAIAAHERGIKAFTLLWDPEKQTIGLKPGDKENPKNQAVVYDAKKSYAALSLGGFFRWIGWDIKERLT